jgi:hypothetical protein
MDTDTDIDENNGYSPDDWIYLHFGYKFFNHTQYSIHKLYEVWQ